MRKYFTAILITFFTIAVLSPAIAHVGGKAKPNIEIDKKALSALVREYTVTLIDSDSSEPITDAQVSLTANMTTPHEMSFNTKLEPTNTPGVYRTMVEFSMLARWEVTVNISGDKVVETKSTFWEDIGLNQGDVTPKALAGNKNKDDRPKTSAKLVTTIKTELSLPDVANIFFSVIHLIFGALWVGSHAFVLLVLRPFIIKPPGKEFISLLMKKYSAIVGFSLGLLIITGIYNIFFNVPAPLTAISNKSSLGPVYFWLLMSKIGLATLAFLIGAYSITIVAPKLKQDNLDTISWDKTAKSMLIISVINFSLGIGILALAGVLGYVHLIIH